jgi:hypothetical protein
MTGRRLGIAWRISWYSGMLTARWRVVRTVRVTFYDLGPLSIEVTKRRP